MRCCLRIISLFLSTPSAGRATCRFWCRRLPTCHFYPRPPWGGRRYYIQIDHGGGLISIHALRGEGDCDVSYKDYPDIIFLSTPSVGRATSSVQSLAWQ